MGFKIARFDEQADHLDDEIDDIDEEFKALLSNRENSQIKQVAGIVDLG